MKKTLLLVLISICSGSFSAQTEKSVKPLPAEALAKEGSFAEASAGTRAVVIGISDYQDPQIPDLRFADKDAEAFANFLRSLAGGSLDGDHLKVLTNEQATGAQVAAALYWLVEESEQGDQVIIYFSGHGDVEAKFMGQPGFLLCWDSPPKVYMGGGSVQLGMLQTVVSTLSTENKVRVVLITDACRSGKLAGSDSNGPLLTNANLAKQFAKEIKILSCQADEYSLEGEQWGGGRGAFSFHLMDGLYGMADDNKDLSVNLQEMRRYLEDHVTPEVAPLAQTPQVIGGNAEKLAAVSPEILAAHRLGREEQLRPFSPTENRGIEDEVLATVDTTLRQLYRLFKKALKDKVFLEPTDACADAYYLRLIAEPKMKRLHASMRRNYAAALQDEAQQALNAYLKADSLEMVDRYKNDPKYTKYPQFLQRAAELLGNNHYMYNSLLARQLYFEGLNLRLKGTDWRKNDSLYHLALEKQVQALALEENVPFVLQEIGQLHQYLRDYGQSLAYFQKAMQRVPKWIIPIMDASRLLTYNLYDYPAAIAYAHKAISIDSTSLDAWLTLANSFHYGGKADSADFIYKQILARWPQDYKSYWYAAMFYSRTENTEASKNVLTHAIERFPDKAILYFELGRLYRFYEWNPELAKKYFYKSISLDSTNLTNHWLLSQTYSFQGKPDSALSIAHQALKIEPNHFGLVSQVALTYQRVGDYRNAEKYYWQAIDINPNYAWAYKALGMLSERHFNDTVVAKRLYLKCNQLNPGVCARVLANLYFVENKPDSALLIIEQGVNADPTWIEGLYWAARLARLWGYFDVGINWFKKITDLNPNSPTGLYHVALSYEIMGKLDSAILTAQALVDHAPVYSGGYELLSKFYRKKGMVNQAIVLLKGGIEKEPGISLYHLLAETYWQNGEPTEALAWYKKATEIGTQNPYEQWMLCLANYRLGNTEALAPCGLEEEKVDEYLLYNNAALYALVGDEEESLKWLKKAFDKFYFDYQSVLIDIDLRNIQDEPEFKALLRKYFPYQFKG